LDRPFTRTPNARPHGTILLEKATQYPSLVLEVCFVASRQALYCQRAFGATTFQNHLAPGKGDSLNCNDARALHP